MTAKKSTKNTSSLEAFIEQMKGFSINEILYAVSETTKEQQVQLQDFVSQAVAADLQDHLSLIGMVPTCPECGSTDSKKKGMRKNIQRYQCKHCGHKYTAATGTILEKSGYTWSAWVKAAYCLLNGYSLPKMQKTLIDDLKCVDVNEKTVWRMRFKIMYALASLPSPPLSGVIKMDDTFFRENQKGCVELYNPIPEDMGIAREPRYGAIPSKFGVMGNEFAAASVMIDETGHMVVRMLGTGTIDDKVSEEFFKAHTHDVRFVCTDADRSLKKVFKRLNIPHYVKPSNYLKVLEKAGYEIASKTDEELAELQREHDSKVMARLYENRKIDRILNFRRLDYPAFCDVKYANGLNLGQVNEIHKEMKDFLMGSKTGVATRWLPYYLALFEYVHNKKIDTGADVVSMTDAEQLLIDAIKTRVNITDAEIDAMRKQPIAEVMASNQYMRNLAAHTEMARNISGNAKFKFTDEDGVENFDARQRLEMMGIVDLKAIAREVKLEGRGSMKKTDLINALWSVEGIHEAIIKVSADLDRVSAVDKSHDKHAHKVEGKNRNVLKGTFAPRMFTHVDEMGAVATDKVVFIDTETTGRNKQHDEILSVAAVDMEGTVKMEQMFRPRHCKRWKDAMAINHITPEMTIGKPSLAEKKPEIEKVMEDADIVVGWNIHFDLRMLYAGGVDMPMTNEKYIDLMQDFTRAYNSTLRGKGKPRYKLAEAAAVVGVDYDAHTALGDTSVLLPIWNWTRDILEASDAPKAA